MAGLLAAAGVPARWRGLERYTILDGSFGDGARVLAAWDAWRRDPLRCARLHLIAHAALDPDPAHLADDPQWAPLSKQLIAAWPPPLPGVHRLFFEDGAVVLDLILDAQAIDPKQIAARVDAIFLTTAAFDAGAAASWARLAIDGAVLASEGLNGQQRQALRQAGFAGALVSNWENERANPIANDSAVAAAAERAVGPASDPAPFAAAFVARRHAHPRAAHADAPPLTNTQRHAIVVGAGLAGACACERLASRGWRVTLIERALLPAQQASGNRAGIFMPVLSQDDDRGARLIRAAYLFALAHWKKTGGIGAAIAGAQCGVLQLARDPVHAAVQRAIAARSHYPPQFAQWLDSDAASAALGAPAAHGAWLFEHGGWAEPGAVCRAMLTACGAALTAHFGQEVRRLQAVDGGWQVIGADEAVIAQAPVVIVATGAVPLAQTAALPVAAVRGQVSDVPASFLPVLGRVVCGDGYVTPPDGSGICSVGATYDNDASPALRAASHDANLARARALLSLPDEPASPLAGRVGFRPVSADRLPLVGALPDDAAVKAMAAASSGKARLERVRDVPRLPGLYGLLGYGSRGLTWAPLAAELLISQLCGDPLPVSADLALALDPARFVVRGARAAGKQAGDDDIAHDGARMTL